MSERHARDWKAWLTRGEKTRHTKLVGRIDKVFSTLTALRQARNKIQNRAAVRAGMGRKTRVRARV